MAEVTPVYVFSRGERSIFAEIYFPRRAAHQGRIFDALRAGHNAPKVKKYLGDNLLDILDELRAYPFLFDPYRYRKRQPRFVENEEELARRRIDMYTSPFRGWSTYQIDGVFIGRRERVYEEATQLIRIMFRNKSRYVRLAKEANCNDVLRAMHFWTIYETGALIEHVPWGTEELSRFLARYESITADKRAFVERHFEAVVKEAQKWIDDCALFIFGYLVRNFCESVLEENLPEEEIWITSFFDLTVNRVRRISVK